MGFIVARKIRIHPQTWEKSICLRAEVYGFDYTSKSTSIIRTVWRVDQSATSMLSIWHDTTDFAKSRPTARQLTTWNLRPEKRFMPTAQWPAGHLQTHDLVACGPQPISSFARPWRRKALALTLYSFTVKSPFHIFVYSVKWDVGLL